MYYYASVRILLLEENMEQLYELTPSQDVVELQCKYTLFKRIINISSSATKDEIVDFDIMQKAFNLIIARNDCLRIKFIKKNKRLMQYFVKPFTVEIPRYSFSTKEEQEEFINKYKIKKIPYRKGTTFEVLFIKTYDNKSMVFMKVTHTILDIYGINIIYKDLFSVYDALVNNKELPQPPTSYEEVVKKDLTKKFDAEFNKSNIEFWNNYFNDKKEPRYIGIHGPENPIYQKQIKKNKNGMKMFFLANQTNCTKQLISKDVVEKIIEFCKNNSCSMENFLFYCFNLVSAKLNNNTETAINLELYNCRGTLLEKKTAGTKAQSLGVYMTFDYSQDFLTNFKNFMDNYNTISRHIGFLDTEFEMLLNKRYKKPLLNTFYSATFSLVPIQKPEGVEIQLYSNGRFVLPSYIALMFNIDTHDIDMVYDYQRKIISQENIETFHKSYVSAMEQILDNPEINIKEVKI